MMANGNGAEAFPKKPSPLDSKESWGRYLVDLWQAGGIKTEADVNQLLEELKGVKKVRFLSRRLGITGKPPIEQKKLLSGISPDPMAKPLGEFEESVGRIGTEKLPDLAKGIAALLKAGLTGLAQIERRPRIELEPKEIRPAREQAKESERAKIIAAANRGVAPPLSTAVSPALSPEIKQQPTLEPSKSARMAELLTELLPAPKEALAAELAPVRAVSTAVAGTKPPKPEPEKEEKATRNELQQLIDMDAAAKRFGDKTIGKLFDMLLPTLKEIREDVPPAPPGANYEERQAVARARLQRVFERSPELAFDVAVLLVGPKAGKAKLEAEAAKAGREAAETAGLSKAELVLPEEPATALTETGAGAAKAGVGVSEAGMAEKAASETPIAAQKVRIKQPFGSRNTIFTKEKFEAAIKRAGKQRPQAGLDPQMFKDFTDIGGFYIEGGIREFGPWSEEMVKQLGERVRPHLQKIYRASITQVDTPAAPEVQAAEQILKGKTAAPPAKPPAPPIRRKPPTGGGAEGELPIPEIVEPVEIPSGKKIATGKQVGRTINFGRFGELTPTEVARVQSRVGELGLGQRRVRTAEDLQQMADQLLTKPEDLLRLGRLDDRSVKGLGDFINITSKRITDLEKKLNNLPVEKRAVAQMDLNRANDQLNLALKKMLPGQTEVGRALQAFRMMAKNNLEPQFWYRKALKEAGVDTFEQMHKGIDIRKQIDALIAEKDIEGLARTVAALSRSSWIDKVLELRKVGLLTSPTTHIRNIFGNLTMTALETAKDPVAAALDVLASGFTGRRTKSFSLGGVGQRAQGLFVSGPKKALQYLKTGRDPEGLMAKWDIPKQINYNNAILSGYRNAVFRTLGAEDVIFRENALRGSLWEQARVQALNEGLKGDIFRQRVTELFRKPTDEMSLQALDDAAYATFQQEGGLAKAGGALRRAAGPVGEFIAPFVRTPSNIAGAFIDYSPAGGLKTLIRMAKKGLTGAERQRIFSEGAARAITGSGILTIGYLLAKENLMTGGLPDDPNERTAWEAEGKTPWSIFIGGKWRRLNTIQPIGNLLSAGADFFNFAKHAPTSGAVAKTGLKTAKSLGEQTFLTGVAGLGKAVANPEREGTKFLAQAAGSIVPSIVAQAARVMEPRIVETRGEGFLESAGRQLASRIPGLRSNLPSRRNIFGEELKIESGAMGQAFDPFASSSPKNVELIKKLNRIGVDLSMPQPRLSGLKLSSVEHDRYSELSGKAVKERLEKLLSQPFFDKLSVERQVKKAEMAIRDERERAGEKLLPEFLKARFPAIREWGSFRVRREFKKLAKTEAFQDADDRKKEEMLEGIFK